MKTALQMAITVYDRAFRSLVAAAMSAAIMVMVVGGAVIAFVGIAGPLFLTDSGPLWKFALLLCAGLVFTGFGVYAGYDLIKNFRRLFLAPHRSIDELATLIHPWRGGTGAAQRHEQMLVKLWLAGALTGIALAAFVFLCVQSQHAPSWDLKIWAAIAVAFVLMLFGVAMCGRLKLRLMQEAPFETPTETVPQETIV